jgi:hypothetical protein
VGHDGPQNTNAAPSIRGTIRHEMKHYRFEVAFGFALAALLCPLHRWKDPGARRKLNRDEIDRYLSAVQRLQMPPDTKAQFLARLRAWMEADDGRPFFNLNVMRNYPKLQRTENDPEFDGTPAESNAHYEALTAPMLVKIGAYPTFAGDVDAANLFGFDPNMDHWSRIAIVRYPSRRAFLDLLSNPAYQEVEPYKAMALEQLLLIPARAELVLPDSSWLIGGASIMLFLGIGWFRSARRARSRE